MDNLGNEVITKVKEAIRAKLKEMNANNSDEIIDYIMLLVTTKKSSAELAKSIDFLMESNTNIFVRWLSTIIKKLQQVTVSTTEKNTSENLQVTKECKNNNPNGDISICEASDLKLDDSYEDNEEFSLKLNVDDENNQISDEEKEAKSLPKLNESRSAKYDNSKIILSPDKLNKIKQNKSFCPVESIKTENNLQLNKKDRVEKSFNEIKNTYKNKDFEINKQSGFESKKNDCNEICDSKRKRPRISINSDDEDEKKKNIRSKVPVTIKEIPKEVTKQLPKKCNKISMSQVVVIKKDTYETKKKMNMNDLIVPRVDHQRGALALDTAFKYIQQQIGASDKEIAVVKKWRDYAVEMLRSSKKV